MTDIWNRPLPHVLIVADLLRAYGYADAQTAGGAMAPGRPIDPAHEGMMPQPAIAPVPGARGGASGHRE